VVKDSSQCDVLKNYTKVTQQLNQIVDLLNDTSIPLPQQPKIERSTKPVESTNADQSRYESYVRKLKKHIVKGDIIQAVPSRRLARSTQLHPFNIYRELRSLNPSPYMFYLDLGDFQIVRRFEFWYNLFSFCWHLPYFLFFVLSMFPYLD
jgi:anthranilate synthase component 1